MGRDAAWTVAFWLLFLATCSPLAAQVWTVTTETEQSQEAQNASTEVISYIQSFRTPAATVEISHSSFPPIVKKEVSQTKTDLTTKRESNQSTASSVNTAEIRSSISPLITSQPSNSSTVPSTTEVGNESETETTLEDKSTHSSTMTMQAAETLQSLIYPTTTAQISQSSTALTIKAETTQSIAPVTRRKIEQSSLAPLIKAEMGQYARILNTSGTTGKFISPSLIVEDTGHSSIASTTTKGISHSLTALAFEAETSQPAKVSIQEEYRQLITAANGIQGARPSSITSPISRETTHFMKVTAFKEETTKVTAFKEETNQSPAALFATLETNRSVTSQITIAETNQPSTAIRTRTETRQSPNAPTMTPELRHSNAASSMKPANNQSFTSLIIGSEMRKMSTGHTTLGEMHELSSAGIVTEAVTQLQTTETTVAVASRSFTNPRFVVEIAELSATKTAQTSLSTSPPNTMAKNKQPYASSVSEAASSQSSAGRTSKKEISQSSISPTTIMEIKQLLTKSTASGENMQSSTSPTIIAKIKQSTIHLANTVGITQWLTDSQTPAETYLSTPAKLTVEMDHNSTIASALEETNRSSVMSATKPEASQSSKPLTTKPTSGQSPTLPIRTAKIPQLMAVLGTSGTTFQVSQAATIEAETTHSMLALTAAEDINQSSSASPTALESKQLSTAKPIIVVETGIQETRQSSVAPPITRETTQFTVYKEETRQSPTVPFTTPEISQSSASQIKIGETNQSSSTITKIEIRKSSSAPTMAADIRHSQTPSSLKPTSSQSFTSQIIGSEIRKISRAQNTPEKISELSSTGIMTEAVSQLQKTQTTVAVASQSFTHPTYAIEIAELSTTNTAQTSLSSNVPTTTSKIRQQYTALVSTAGSSQSSAGLTATPGISQSSISPTITKEIKPLLPKSTASGENMQSSTTPTFIAKTMQSFIPLSNTTATAQQSTDLQTPAEIYSSTFANLRAEINHYSTVSTAIEETDLSSVISATTREKSLTTKAASSPSLTRPIRTAKVQQSETAFGNFGPTFESSKDATTETEINHLMLALTPAEDVNQSSTTLEVRQSSTATVITGEKRQSSTSQTTTGKTALSMSKGTSQSTKAATSTVEMKQLFTSPSSILDIRQRPTVQIITGINIQSTPSSIMTAETSQFPRTKREGSIQTASTTKAQRELPADQNEAVTRQLPTAPAITVEVSQQSTARRTRENNIQSAKTPFVKSENQAFSTYLETSLPSRGSLNTILSTHLFTSSIISPEVSQSSIAPIIKVETMKSSTAPIIIKQTNLSAALTVSSSIPATEPTTPAPTIQSSTASTIKSNGIQLTAFPITEIETRQSLRGTFASEKSSESVEALNMKTASYVTAESSQLPTIPSITSQSSRWEKETIQSTGRNIKTEPILSSNIPIIASDTRQPFITATNVIQSADPLKTTHIGQLIQKSSSAPPLTAPNTTSVEVPKSATSEPTTTEPSGSAANRKQTIQTSTVLQTTQTVHSGALCDQSDCLWSLWYNIYTPSRRADDGDFETFQNIRAQGYDVCEAPRDVSCRSVKFSYIPFAKLPNNATCSVTEGLKCYNRENTPNGCLDYQIRVLCCPCQRGGSPPALPASVTTLPTLLAALAESTIKTQTRQPTTAHTSSTSSVPVPKTSPCNMSDCVWSPWYNVYSPRRSSDDGDFETFENIRARGNAVCEAPSDVSCRSVRFSYIPFPQLPNTATCSVTDGLKCYNRDNEPNGCLDYEIRVLCCPCQHGGFASTSSATTTSHITIPTALPKSTITVQTSPRLTARTTTSTTTVPVQKIPPCNQSACEWSPWYNVYTPSKRFDDGEFETYENIRAQGYAVCEAPSDVSCRSVRFSYIPFPQLPNTATCSVTDGLKCYNRDNEPNGCLDYEIRVLCCPCQHGGFASTSSATTTSHITIPTALPKSTITVQTSPRLTARTTTSTTTVPVQNIPPCNQSACEWSPWYNVYTPSKRFDDGEFETYENIRARGYAVCEAPSDVSCRSVRFSYIPFPQLPNTATCSVTIGLKCYNRDNEPNGCLDYEIRVLCCPCQHGRFASTSSATTTSHITIPTALPKSTITVQTSPRLTARTTTSTTTVPVQNIPPCNQSACEWSPWYNVYTPSKRFDDGEFETYENIRARGYAVCEAPSDVSCRSVRFSYIPFPQLPNTATCSVTIGLKCYNRDNEPNGCLDYEIRVLCCPCQHGRFASTSSATTTSHITIPTALPKSTITVQTSPRLTARTTTSTTTVPVQKIPPCNQSACEWSPWYNVYTPSKRFDDGEFETYENIRARGYAVCEAPSDVSCRSVRFSYIPFPQLPNTATCSVTDGLKCYNRDNEPNGCLDYEIRVLCCPCQHGGFASTSSATTTSHITIPTALPKSTITVQTSPRLTARTTTSTTTVPVQKIPPCNQSACEWSPWYNVYTPSKRFDDGEFETYENIRARGYAVCEAPSDVSCRSVRFSYIPFPQLPNTATCSVTYGLKCYNKDNEPNGCLDYQIRILCCRCVH